jgi:hypothetical protein
MGRGARGEGKWEDEAPAEPNLPANREMANRQVGKDVDSP